MESQKKIIIIILLLVSFYCCKNTSNRPVAQIITDKDVKFGAFMLKGSGYTAQLRVFIEKGELDCHIKDYDEKIPASIDFHHLSTICSSGITWDDVVMLNSSYEVANYLKNKMTASNLACIEIKVASFSTSMNDSTNYILYTKKCIE
jgi:hypothetical protein